MAQRIARRWDECEIGEQWLLRTLDCYGVQKQVGKFRERHPLCAGWKWTTRSVAGGVIVKRVQ